MVFLTDCESHRREDARLCSEKIVWSVGMDGKSGGEGVEPRDAERTVSLQDAPRQLGLLQTQVPQSLFGFLQASKQCMGLPKENGSDRTWLHAGSQVCLSLLIIRV